MTLNADPARSVDAVTGTDPLGRDVIPNAPLPRRPWWVLALAGLGFIAAAALLLYFADGLLENIATIDPAQRTSFNATTLAVVGALLSLAMVIGYGKWFLGNRETFGTRRTLYALLTATAVLGVFTKATA